MGDVRLDQRQRLLRKELRKLLPANQDDVAAIEAIAARGYPAMEPILLDLLKWTRHDHWPVAKPAREFLASLGGQLAPEVHEALGSSDAALKAAVLRHVVSQWSSDDVHGVSSRLFMIATDGQSWGADLLALRLLAQHGIGDPEWIAGWLGFKREYHERRLADIAEIFDVLKSKELPDAAADGGLQEP
jgi:hypothetical protein